MSRRRGTAWGCPGPALLPDTSGDRPADPAAVRRALETVADLPVEVADEARALTLPITDRTPAGLIRLGADTHRLRAALAAEAVASAAVPHEDGVRLSLSAS